MYTYTVFGMWCAKNTRKPVLHAPKTMKVDALEEKSFPINRLFLWPTHTYLFHNALIKGKPITIAPYTENLFPV